MWSFINQYARNNDLGNNSVCGDTDNYRIFVLSKPPMDGKNVSANGQHGERGAGYYFQKNG